MPAKPLGVTAANVPKYNAIVERGKELGEATESSVSSQEPSHIEVPTGQIIPRRRSESDEQSFFRLNVNTTYSLRKRPREPSEELGVSDPGDPEPAASQPTEKALGKHPVADVPAKPAEKLVDNVVESIETPPIRLVTDNGFRFPPILSSSLR